MKIRPLLLIASLLAMLPLAAVAEMPFPVFSPKSGLADGWKIDAWAGPVASQPEGGTKGSTMIQVVVDTGSQVYSGVALNAIQGSGVLSPTRCAGAE